MPGFVPFHAAIRMMHSTHASLLAWAAELWPEPGPASPPVAEVVVERDGAEWTVSATREGIAGLALGAAQPGRADEAAFFLEAFERRAALLESLVRVLLPRHLARLERGEWTPPLAAAAVATLLAETTGTPTTASTVAYLAMNKVVRAPAGVVPLADLIR